MISAYSSSTSFPDNPSDGEKVTIDGITYQWDASVGAWIRINTGGGGGGGPTYTFKSPLFENSSNNQVSFNWASMSSLP